MIFDLLRDLIHLLPLSLAICLGLFPDPKIPAVLLCLCSDFLFLFLLYQNKQRRLMIGISSAVIFLLYFLINGLPADAGRYLLIGIVCLSCLLIIKAVERHPFGRYLVIGACFFLLFLSIVDKAKTDKVVFLPFFFFLLINIVEIIQIRWPKQGNTDLNMHSLYLAPLLLLMILMLGRFQLPDRPYEWDFLKSTGWWIRAKWESLINKYDFSSSNDSDSLFTGFSNVVSLGNGLYKNSRRIMKVSSSYYGKDIIKLGGKTFDTFEDLRWIKTDKSSLDYRTYDVLESLCAVISSDGDIYFDHLRNVYLDIDCSGIVTAHIFHPLKSLPYIEKTPLTQSGGDLFFDSTIKPSYRIRFYHFFRNDEDLKNAIADQRPVDAVAFSEALKIVTSADPKICTFEGFKAYQKTIRDIYGQKPLISAKTAGLLEETVKDAATDYEKLLAIEKLLSSLHYDLEPGELPESVNTAADFLDYLLFESQKGYCVHYATAFVLLARAQGLPARFVQGYAFSLRNGQADVRSYMAHAWPEVYLDGFGWLDFEPTPPSHPTTGTQQTVSVEEATDSGIVSAQDDKNTDPVRFVQIFLICIAFVSVLIPVFEVIHKIRFDRLPPAQKIRILFKQNLRLLKRMGSGLRKNETLSEFALRLKDTRYSRTADIIPVYEELIYGSRIVDENDVVLFKENKKRLIRLFFGRLFSRIRIRKSA
ncbi:MAG: transglutaminase domain-containing protein [Erysipelotrichaceae bacterium]|nr:transglutaminase domain-containing protein [Erysipelotrichaceae bacterium]